jgi:hypothetical protein
MTKKGYNQFQYPIPPEVYNQQWALSLIDLLRVHDNRTPIAPAIEAIEVTNYTHRTTFNKSVDSTSDFIDLMCTIVDALKDAGYIG